MKATGPSAGTTNWDDIECERSEPNYATGKNFRTTPFTLPENAPLIENS